MLRKITTLITLFLVTATLASAQTWSQPFLVGAGTTPDFDIDPATGNLHIVHHKDGVMYTKMSLQGDTLYQKPIAEAWFDKHGRYQFGATIAYDPTTDRVHVCYRNERGRGSWNFDVYYIEQNTDMTWTSPLKIINNLYRAYMVRMEVDQRGRAHIIQGYSDGGGDIFGRATYFRINNSRIERTHENLHRYRADDHAEIALGKDDDIHIVLSSPDRKDNDPTFGGPVSYHRSQNEGQSLELVGNIRDGDARDRVGNADIYADPSGNVHFCYGAKIDNAINNEHSLRYARFEDGVKVRDVVVNAPGELLDWQHSLGKGSVAASDDGSKVVIVYNIADDLELRARFSADSGATWSDAVKLADASGGADGREKHVVRATGNRFHLVYPAEGEVFMRKLIFGVPPVADAGGPYSAGEGEEILFTAEASASNDGQELVSYRWDWNNDAVFDTTTSNATLQYSFGDDYSGRVALEVTDKDGLTDTANVQVEISNLAPSVALPDVLVLPLDSAYVMKPVIIDPGSNDSHEISWDLDADGNFETSADSVILQYSVDSDQLIAVRVQDDDGGVTVAQSAVFAGGTQPRLRAIPDQTVQEGTAFEQIQLSAYAVDPDHEAAQLTWAAIPESGLFASLDGDLATIAPADSEWAGTANVSFIARDPDNQSDTTSVQFTVTAVNDAPQLLRAIPDQQTDMGVAFAAIDLASYLFDADHELSSLQVIPAVSARLGFRVTGLLLTPIVLDTTWAGSETVAFTVKDPEGAEAVFNISFTVTGTVGVEFSLAGVPEQFSLDPNYPNPFNPQTSIPYQLKEPADVNLSLYSLDGQRIAVLVQQNKTAGSHKAVWHAGQYASGAYFAVLQVRVAGRLVYQAQRKLLYLR